MKRFEKIKAKVIPLVLRDVDTDMILPAEFLTNVTKTGYGQNLFKRLCAEQPDFSFNQSKYAGSRILVADHNFGCGSSREHAVWALQGWGIEVIIAKSFADIFASNSSKNGLLLITLPVEVVEHLQALALDGSLELSVDLESQTVTEPDGTIRGFDYDPFKKHCLLTGLDDIDYILSKQAEIKAFRAKERCLIDPQSSINSDQV